MKHYKQPDIQALKRDLDVIEKEAVAGTAIAGAVGTGLAGLGAIGSGLFNAGAQTLDTVVGLAKDSFPWFVGGAASSGLAAAYLAHKMKNIGPRDIDVHRSEFYKEDLKRRLGEIRKQQTIAEQQRKEQPAKEPTLRLS